MDDFIRNLHMFVEGWIIAAENDQIPLEKIDVNLVGILEDICEMANIDPLEIGLKKGELT